MVAQAPICHIPPEQTPSVRGPVALPSIPIAIPNLTSLVASVNALRDVVQFLAGQKPVNNGVTNNFTTKKDAEKGRWNEVSRVTETVRVYQNNDKNTGNYVDIERINQLKMGDKVTGEQWLWNRSKG